MEREVQNRFDEAQHDLLEGFKLLKPVPFPGGRMSHPLHDMKIRQGGRANIIDLNSPRCFLKLRLLASYLALSPELRKREIHKNSRLRTRWRSSDIMGEVNPSIHHEVYHAIESTRNIMEKN
eukprot:Gb_18829 [translate_table: standard]